MKTCIILILISNMFMLTVADILKFFKCRKLVNTIIKQANTNIEFVENQLGGNK